MNEVNRAFYDALTPDDCLRIFHKALENGDIPGVEAVLHILAVKDPHRAAGLIDSALVALQLVRNTEEAARWADIAPGLTRAASRQGGPRAPMVPAQITGFIESVLEDYLGDSEPPSRHQEIAESLAESWLQDRSRALGEAAGGGDRG